MTLFVTTKNVFRHCQISPMGPHNSLNSELRITVLYFVPKQCFLKNPAVTYLLIMLLVMPLVSPCFWVLVGCLLDVSKSIKTTKEQMQCSSHAAAPVFPVTWGTATPSFPLSVSMYFGVLMISYSSHTPRLVPSLHICRFCHHGLHCQWACVRDNRKFHFLSIHSLHHSEGLVKQHIWKVANVHT